MSLINIPGMENTPFLLGILIVVLVLLTIIIIIKVIYAKWLWACPNCGQTLKYKWYQTPLSAAKNTVTKICPACKKKGAFGRSHKDQ